jgi:hypothetical protein
MNKQPAPSWGEILTDVLGFLLFGALMLVVIIILVALT